METEEDMAGYFDSVAGHGVTAVFTNSQSQQSIINIIINKLDFNDNLQVFVINFLNSEKYFFFLCFGIIFFVDPAIRLYKSQKYIAIT